jgi:flagellar hook-basal body complex protein FliE
MSLPHVHAVGAISPVDPVIARGPEGPAPAPARGTSFSQMLLGGIDHVNQQLTEADAKVAAFALDDTIPPHQVILAIDEARHSLELMLQVRSRLVEGFQEIMRMQL